ncbi:hypothetical protein SRHO_G00022430 [Serrasalmus rhombeus]
MIRALGVLSYLWEEPCQPCVMSFVFVCNKIITCALERGISPPRIHTHTHSANFAFVPGSSGGSRTDTVVEVSVLDSPVLSLSVPAELELPDPAFIEYIAKEALLAYQNTLANALHSCQGGLAHPRSHDG